MVVYMTITIVNNRFEESKAFEMILHLKMLEEITAILCLSDKSEFFLLIFCKTIVDSQ